MRYALPTGFLACFVSLAAIATAADVDQLIKSASSQDKKTALGAIDGLAAAGARAHTAVPALMKTLSNTDADIQYHSARALGLIGPRASSSVPSLLKLLASDNIKIRACAAFALGKIGNQSKQVVDALVKTAFDKSPVVRRESLSALWQLDPPQEDIREKLLEILDDGDMNVIIPALQSLAKGGAAVVPKLRNALGNEKTCYWACLVLSEIGPDAKDAVPELKPLLKHEHPEIRLQALLALGEIGQAGKPLVPDVVALLQNEKEAGIPYAAVFALGNIGTNSTGTKLLKEALGGKDPVMRMLAAWALAKNNPNDKTLVNQAIELAIQGFTSDNPFLRSLAAEAVVEFDAPIDKVGPLLVDALKDKDPKVVGNAIDALVQLKGKALKHIDKALANKDLRPYAILLVANLGPDAQSAVPALIKILKEKSGDENQSAFQRETQIALAMIGPGAKDAVPVLKEALSSEDEAISASATYALGKIGPAARAAVPGIRKNLKSPNEIVRLASLGALLEIMPSDARLATMAFSPLVQGLDNEHEMVRAACATALGNLKGRAKTVIPKLEILTKDNSSIVRIAAEKAIEELKK